MYFRKISLAVICLLSVSVVRSQDIHFSQFTETPQLLNPGATGVYNGYMRAIINYRNQWAIMGNSFKTVAASFDIPLFDYKENRAHMGAGINFFNDQAGDAKFGLTQANLCLSGIIPVSRNSKFSLGVSVGGAQHKANYSALNWGSQYNGTGSGFDPTIPSGETGSISSAMYLDLGAGLYYEYNSGKATLDRNEQKRFGVGVAYYHANRPSIKYYTATEKLYGKFVATFNGHFDKTGTKVSFRPSAMYVMQGPATEITVGTSIRYRIRNGTKITGFYSETGIAFGVHYRFGDAIIPSLNFEMQNFSLTASYDVNISAFKQATQSKGGYEFALKYHIGKGALFKRKRMV
ncbi:MAG: PorP/SprF family type IX secretion system membrane protein [Bacteroidota bacterium]|nr:PorP/SprF family type IX secretion system membrane protein [Bacteroidota bacterium]